jgi:hypothetical protein
VEVRPVVLDPPTYTCPDDHADLTALVAGALGGDGLPVARFAHPELQLMPRHRATLAPQPFEVIVTCPGPPGNPRPHQLTCAGTYQP